jgi:hypothetical protein
MNRMYPNFSDDRSAINLFLQLAFIGYNWFSFKTNLDCVTPSDRDIYVKALMSHIKVDSYGKCLNNKKLPENLSVAVKSFNSVDFYRIIAKYKFVIAMENAVCDDYVFVF